MDHGTRLLRLCLYLTRMEFDRRFAGSLGGKFWLFAGPLMTIFVIWTVMNFGLGIRTTSGAAYGMSLTVGLCAWLFFSEAVNSSLSSIIGSPHLVKKVVFPVILLPLSYVMAAFVVHLLVVAVVVLILITQGQFPSLNFFALPFWSFCLFLFTAATAILTAGLSVIFRDTTAIVPNFISALFWLTPVIWPISNIPTEWQRVALWNPAAVIVEGYRFSLLGSSNGVGVVGTASFFIGLAVFVFASVAVFRKIRPWFANVL